MPCALKNKMATGVKQLENESHLLIIVILLLVIAAYVIGESNIRQSSEAKHTINASSASHSTILSN